jgi:hypothetical protein
MFEYRIAAYILPLSLEVPKGHKGEGWGEGENTTPKHSHPQGRIKSAT